MVFGDAIASVWYPIGRTHLAVQNDISKFQTSNTNDFYEVFNNVSKPPKSGYNRLYTKNRLARKIDLASWTIVGFIVPGVVLCEIRQHRKRSRTRRG